MDKWPGGQNGGNYCHRTEYRKINISIKRNEDSLRGFWGNIKFTNIHLIRVPKEEEREKGPKKIFEETIAEKFPNMGKERVNQVQEVQRIPGRINPRRNTPRHIIIKLTKIKDRDKILKAKGEKRQYTKKLLWAYQLISQQKLYNSENSLLRREWHDIFKVVTLQQKE